MNENYCNNCGKVGHYYHNCKMPITSIGIVVFRISKENNYEYLMIRRKDTLGYIDFMRGKYSVYNKEYIMNMLKQMTKEEKEVLNSNDFNAAWSRIWGINSISNQYKSEESISRDKFQLLNNGIFNKNIFYTLQTMIEESNNYDSWEEPEWGFPKGRRNFQEKDFDCAIREFKEETGYNPNSLKNIKNIYPFEEIFTGSNYKSYKYKYYLAFLDYETSLNTKSFDSTEVSKMEWKSFEDCIKSIRSYNLEKKRLITNINNTLNTLFSGQGNQGSPRTPLLLRGTNC
jgi:ADP-ribose pyrophosphatase YjhB (NUDIX family)